jgi:two-component system, OmpR family, sensor histidine kinase KdpD
MLSQESGIGKSVHSRIVGCGAATVGVLSLTGIINLFNLGSSPSNAPILYFLVVTLAALRWGRSAAIWASICSFLCINWFFLTPRNTFIVSSQSDWISLCMFLFTATVTGQLTALLKARAFEARQLQREVSALSEATWAVASQLDTKSALVEVINQVAKVVDLERAAIVATQDGQSSVVALYPDDYSSPQEHNLEYWYDGGGTKIPIEMNQKSLGFVCLKLGDSKSVTPAQKQLIDALVNHSAIILQRDGLMKSESHSIALAEGDKLKTALLSMVSHDFRSPLTSIKACVTTLLGEGRPLEPQVQRELYEAIDQESDRLNLIVGNVLDLSRLEADNWRPRLEVTPLTELLGMVLDSFDVESNKRIIVTIHPEVNEVLVDCIQMAQVLKNLLENALKYSPAGTAVEIRTAIENGNAKIDIIDNGRGLSDEEKTKIFDPFFRGSGLKESSIPGLGIGLAVCKGLVEAHRGSLTAETREGGGAIFSIMLPLEEVRADS